jgi:hypothetical protein
VEVYVEEVAGGAVVTGRIVFAGKRAVQEIARLSMSRAAWEEFTRCLGTPGDRDRRRVVLKPARPEPAPAGRRASPPVGAEALPERLADVFLESRQTPA